MPPQSACASRSHCNFTQDNEGVQGVGFALLTGEEDILDRRWMPNVIRYYPQGVLYMVAGSRLETVLHLSVACRSRLDLNNSFAYSSNHPACIRLFSSWCALQQCPYLAKCSFTLQR